MGTFEITADAWDFTPADDMTLTEVIALLKQVNLQIWGNSHFAKFKEAGLERHFTKRAQPGEAQVASASERPSEPEVPDWASVENK